VARNRDKLCLQALAENTRVAIPLYAGQGATAQRPVNVNIAIG
jgi:hypothetical protein